MTDNKDIAPNEAVVVNSYLYRLCLSDGSFFIYQKDTTDGKFITFCVIWKYRFQDTPLVEYTEGFDRFADAYKAMKKRQYKLRRNHIVC